MKMESRRWGEGESEVNESCDGKQIWSICTDQQKKRPSITQCGRWMSGGSIRLSITNPLWQLLFALCRHGLPSSSVIYSLMQFPPLKSRLPRPELAVPQEIYLPAGTERWSSTVCSSRTNQPDDLLFVSPKPPSGSRLSSIYMRLCRQISKVSLSATLCLQNIHVRYNPQCPGHACLQAGKPSDKEKTNGKTTVKQHRCVNGIQTGQKYSQFVLK